MNTRLETAFAERFGCNYGITFNSGTTTLHTALESFGVGYGDEVIVTPLTVISCMNAILYCNEIPVFDDVDPDRTKLRVSTEDLHPNDKGHEYIAEIMYDTYKEIYL